LAAAFGGVRVVVADGVQADLSDGVTVTAVTSAV
jgi:hypothetical protein